MPISKTFEDLAVSDLTVGKEIGRGAFGRVFNATFKGRPAALKVLQPLNNQSAEDQATAEQLFKREAQSMAAIQHPHILSCFAVGMLPGDIAPGVPGPALAMVTELCEPFTPKNLIIRCMTEGSRAYSNLEALDWLLQIARALSHLHRQRPTIIHRDVKQENILLRREGKKGYVAKLADLGLHVVIEPERSVMLRKRSTKVLMPDVLEPAVLASRHDSFMTAGAAMRAGAAGGTPKPTAAGDDGTDSPFLTISQGNSRMASMTAPFARGASFLAPKRASSTAARHGAAEDAAGSRPTDVASQPLTQAGVRLAPQGPATAPSSKPADSNEQLAQALQSRLAQMVAAGAEVKAEAEAAVVSEAGPSVSLRLVSLPPSPPSPHAEAALGTRLPSAFEFSTQHSGPNPFALAAGSSGKTLAPRGFRAEPGSPAGMISVDVSSAGGGAGARPQPSLLLPPLPGARLAPSRAAAAAAAAAAADDDAFVRQGTPAAGGPAGPVGEATLLSGPREPVDCVQRGDTGTSASSGGGGGTAAPSGGMVPALDVPRASSLSAASAGAAAAVRGAVPSPLYAWHNGGPGPRQHVSGSRRGKSFEATLSPALRTAGSGGARTDGSGGALCTVGSAGTAVVAGTGPSTAASPPLTPGGAPSSETFSTMLTRCPEMLEPVNVDRPSGGLRVMSSLLQQLGQRELKPLRGGMEWVYGLTGQAGSAMYMPPEVFKNLPYNEKADVFSFGVLAYELLARDLLIISIFNTGRAARMRLREPYDYAELVSRGHRPSRPKSLGDAAWALVEACWHDDPVQRPSMEEAEEALGELREAELARSGGGGGGSSGCGPCVIS